MTRSDQLRDLSRMATFAVRLAACIALVALMSGCGPLGDDEEEEPTPTRSASPVAAASPPASPPALATPSAGSSPTARSASDDDDGTPVARPTRVATSDAEADESPDAEDDEHPEDADEEATEEADDEPPAPPVVEDCEEPEELPAVQGAADRITSVEADEGVNLRAGPGADCDLLSTLQPGTPVEVVSGPVSAGDFLWVKVEAADAEGWMAEEFLEPVED